MYDESSNWDDKKLEFKHLLDMFSNNAVSMMFTYLLLLTAFAEVMSIHQDLWDTILLPCERNFSIALMPELFQGIE